MTVIYGIKNCDTVKKTLKWLDNNNINYEFHDFRVNGINTTLINKFTQLIDWELLLNKRSTTFRALDESIKKNLDENTFKNIVLEQPTLIKRPVLLINNTLHVGFKEQQYQELFN
ncbi:ArsC family reductase [Thalassotalea profundi]|uniref:Arsenate reductase n=1 Tax=Thalassotalea profundi TaxID=2036687 RepID=A0ABQ3IVB2_9GAMM|nr:ArsC family reductase [Thalassotalea profundi]GHE90266.1 arsenate reductase [Thalassotalea profundi]